MIVKQNITQQVIEYLKTNIKNGNWNVGEKIPSENKLTEMLGVSRASVRVAIQQFIAIGILDSIHGKGTFLKSNDLSAFGNGLNKINRYDSFDLSKVLEFRIIVETESCLLAAQNATKENIENLNIYLNKMKESVGKSEEFVKYDMMFHEEISRATANPLLEKCLKEFFQQKVKNHKQLNEIFGYQDGIFYHTVILKAIEAGNGTNAKKLMHDHLQKAIDELKIKLY